MKTTGKIVSDVLSGIGKHSIKGLLSITAILGSMAIHAQVPNNVITITSSQSTNPLIERWITEYSKLNPSQSFKLIAGGESTDKADLKLAYYANDSENMINDQVKVARLAILPVVNEKNTSFSKELKKGIKLDELKQIFLKIDNDEIESDKSKKGEANYTVYTKTPQSGLAIAISNYLGKSSDDLNGVYVTGDDKYLITSVLEDSTGVTYSNLGLIYDLSKRSVINGLKVLPIDLNGNKKLDKDEQIYDNLDRVLAYLEGSENAVVPTGYLSFSLSKNTKNPEISNFVNWVKVYGQEYNHQYGFLNIGSIQNLSLK